jgi:hypothetical protein
MRLVCVASAVSDCAGGCVRQSASTITQEELVRRTQQLFDSIPSGDRTPWEKYYAADCFFFDQKSSAMDKKSLVDDQSLMPAGYSGEIRMCRAGFWKMRRF